jgi:hypothetical protein
MKLSDWKKKYDEQNQNCSLRIIDSNELLEITEFDNQPERSKREDIPIKNPCKHFVQYGIQDKDDNISTYFYEDLDPIMKQCADDSWENYGMMRCSEHCGNTVREVQ